ncbi:MAG: lysyl endopeptidase [Glaciecola sp.]
MILLCATQICHAQIFQGAMPLSYNHVDLIEDNGVPTINLVVPDVNTLVVQDLADTRADAIWRDAVALVVNAGISDDGFGLWYDLGSLGKVWKLRLKANGAVSMELNFDEFSIPNGAILTIYNPEHTNHLGGYTSLNNKDFSSLSTHMIQGDECIVEYYIPTGVGVNGSLHIKDIAYRYKDVLRIDDGGGSQSCEIDVNCAEGTNWVNAKKSTVRIRSRIGDDFFWSSGALVNNTGQDCKPFILSSFRTTINPHNLEFSSFEDFQYYRFYFNYERSECVEGVGLDKSISGAYMRTNSNDNGGEQGSDFILFELSTDIPEAYNVYWSGWNTLDNPEAFSGVCIHHPMGDVKKISTFNSVPVSANYGISNTHWKVLWDETESGKGVTEIGSNGAPLFDEEGRIFGTLTAGGSSCEEEFPGGSENPDFFGKMNKHWIENPNPIPLKLRSWLDPAATGLSLFDGSLNPCVVGIESESFLENMKMYPNPANSYVIISQDEGFEGSILVFDQRGKLVVSKDISTQSTYRIDISHLRNGMYFLELILDEGASRHSKLLIQR